MATPNYSYEKRQRELAKKRKAEEKRLRKTHKDADGAPADTAAEGTEPADGTPPATPPADPGTA